MAKKVEAIRHADAKRVNIPPAEFEPLVDEREKSPVRIAYERRNRDLDPQLVWSGKDRQDESDLVVTAPPLFIQEKIHPKAIIDDLLRRSRELARKEPEPIPDLFADFNGIEDPEKKLEFYRHEANWTNRMILGDSLQVMASLAEREGLRGKVQCIYMDPPYGIRFNSNFQWSTTSREVKDGDVGHITREPEQVKAYRDTWRDGIHSYLSYLRDRLTVARDLLHESGSIFVQIGDENVHRVRCLLDEVFGEDNCITEILFKKKGSQKGATLASVNDYILWYAKDRELLKYRPLFEERDLDEETIREFSKIELRDGSVINLRRAYKRDGEAVDYVVEHRRIQSDFPTGRLFRPWPITNGGVRTNQMDPLRLMGMLFRPPSGRCWRHPSRKTSDQDILSPMERLSAANRTIVSGTSVDFKRYFNDFPFKSISNWWDHLGGASGQLYVVQTNEKIVERSILMASDPGDIVLDPTCGSGTTAWAAEKWGRRWIVIDTSRVALALARARLMGGRFPSYMLKDSQQGVEKVAQMTGRSPRREGTHNRVKEGFVYRRYARINSTTIANNREIDVIWENRQPAVEAALAELNGALRGHDITFEVQAGGRKGKKIDFAAPEEARDRLPCGEEAPAYALLEWEVPRDFPEDWPEMAREPFDHFWQARAIRQREIDESISRNAESVELVDRPYVDNSRVRVTGPFTVESLSPVRAPLVDEEGEPRLRELAEAGPGYRYEGEVEERDFASYVLEQLKTTGVAQARKEDRIRFTALEPWPGELVCAAGRYLDGETERRAGILVGPEFGTVSRADLVEAAREAAEAGFDILIACAFNFEAQAADLRKLGKIPVLKARLNPELHMGELDTKKGANIAVVFGEPDVEIEETEDGRIRVRIKGVDVFDPKSGDVRSEGPEGIACWFLDTDYSGESFFVRHAYFLGMNADPFKALKTSLRAEIDEEAWATLYRDVSYPFPKPSTGRIAVKVINHLGDEVMRVLRVC